jgi:splicing factor 3B subunit 3
MCVVDYNTVACGDKFGNIFTLRLPETVNEDHSFRLHGGAQGGLNTNLWEHGLLNGAPNKLELVNHYYLGEIPTSISKASLKDHGKEVLIVSTITGGLYAFVPHHSKEDHQFYQHLEMFMRKEYSNLTQRDHLSYRSLYQPVKNTIDMSLCERFMSLPYPKQKDFGDTVDRTPTEVVKKLEDVSNFL